MLRRSVRSPLLPKPLTRLQSSAPTDHHCGLQIFRKSFSSALQANGEGIPRRNIAMRLSVQSSRLPKRLTRLQLSAPADHYCGLQIFRNLVLSPLRATDEGIPRRKIALRLSVQSPRLPKRLTRLQSSAPADHHCGLQIFRN